MPAGAGSTGLPRSPRGGHASRAVEHTGRLSHGSVGRSVPVGTARVYILRTDFRAPQTCTPTWTFSLYGWISCIQMRHTRTPTTSENIREHPNPVCRALLLAPETGFPMVRALHSAALGRHSLSRMALWPTRRAGTGAGGQAVDELDGRVGRVHEVASRPHAAAPPWWRSFAAEKASGRYRRGIADGSADFSPAKRTPALASFLTVKLQSGRTFYSPDFTSL